MKRTLLILNVKAGKQKGKTFLFEVLEQLSHAGHRVTVAMTECCGHAKILASEAKEYDLVVLMGGDGTLNEVVQGMMEQGIKVPIGYIPTGSTNDFAASLKIESHPKKAVASILNGSACPLDVGRFQERYFTYVASFGAFTSSSYNTPQNMKNMLGHQAYVLEGIKEILNFKTYHISLKSPDRMWEGECLFGSVSNTTRLGGTIKFPADLVDLDDGLLEVFVIKKPKNLGEWNAILHGMMHSDFSGEMFEFFKTREVWIESDGSFPWTLDGEKAEGDACVHIENIPKAIKIMK